MAERRPLRGPRFAAVMAVPDRDERAASTCSAGATAAHGRWTSGRRSEPLVENLNARSEVTWIEPIQDPADVVAAREGVRLAFVAALQRLPPRQRAALILCEVLHWQAARRPSCSRRASASINSALQRARATLGPPTADGRRGGGRRRAAGALCGGVRGLRHRRADRRDPRGRDAVDAALRHVARRPRGRFTWWFGPGIECAGSRVIPAGRANGLPAFGAVQARARRRPRPVGAAGRRVLRRRRQRADVLPRHRAPVPAVRSARPSRGLSSTASRPANAISSRSSRGAPRSATRGRAAAPRRRGARARRRCRGREAQPGHVADDRRPGIALIRSDRARAVLIGNTPRQGSNGGASPQPQRGTGACSTTAAPGQSCGARCACPIRGRRRAQSGTRGRRAAGRRRRRGSSAMRSETAARA